MRLGWYILPIAAGVVIMALAAAGWMGQRSLLDALRGQPPEVVDHGRVGDPLQALGLPFQELMVPTELGPAPAWLVTGAQDAPFAAIFVHGIAGQRQDGYDFLGPLHRQGIPVLLISYRKDLAAPQPVQGLHTLGLDEWRDLEAAVRLMEAQGHRRVVLAAGSMGGAIVGAFLSNSTEAGAVVGLMLDAPLVDFPLTLQQIIADARIPLPGIVSALSIRALAMSHGIDLSLVRHIPVLADFRGPVMLAHGRNDNVVPIRTSLEILSRRHGATIWLPSDGGHLETSLLRPKEFATAIDATVDMIRAAADP